MKKVIFIVNAIQSITCIKRIEEFIDRGYNIKAYGFSRNAAIHTKPTKFDIEVIGTIENKGKYFSRLFKLYKSLRSVIKKHKNDDVIYYYFGLDMAIVSRIITTNMYIFEECDLSHTYINNKLFRLIFEYIDKKIINSSFETVLTSEGFRIYHFNNLVQQNVTIIPNRLNKNLLAISNCKNKIFDPSNIHIGFVGGARFNSILNFALVFSTEFPNHKFHFFGNPLEQNKFDVLKNNSNVYFHGPFQNPNDLPKIYASIDLVLCTYDIEIDNVCYAEPNKLYESIYFEIPIIVSNGTFLAEKVNKLGIGFTINPLDDEEIKCLINNLTSKEYYIKKSNCVKIPKVETIDDNSEFFHKLKIKFASLL